MSEILDRVFPLGQCEENILGGYEDFSYTRATEFFKGLSEADREIVQWYAGQSLSPAIIENYAFDLARGYAVVDPDRTCSGGIASAHLEIARVRRFAELSMISDGYFPILVQYKEPVFDEDGTQTGAINIMGWANLLADYEFRKVFKEYIPDTMTLYDNIDRFLDDPSAAPGVFNQDRIIAKHKETIEAGTVE